MVQINLLPSRAWSKGNKGLGKVMYAPGCIIAMGMGSFAGGREAVGPRTRTVSRHIDQFMGD
jgi:hypothetical protein